MYTDSKKWLGIVSNESIFEKVKRYSQNPVTSYIPFTFDSLFNRDNVIRVV